MDLHNLCKSFCSFLSNTLAKHFSLKWSHFDVTTLCHKLDMTSWSSIKIITSWLLFNFQTNKLKWCMITRKPNYFVWTILSMLDQHTWDGSTSFTIPICFLVSNYKHYMKKFSMWEAGLCICSLHSDTWKHISHDQTIN